MSDLLKKATDALTAARFTSPDVDRPDLWIRDDGTCRESVSIGKDRARISLNVPVEQVASILTPAPSILSGGVTLTDKEREVVLSALGDFMDKASQHTTSPYQDEEGRENWRKMGDVARDLFTRLTGGGNA